MNVNVERIRNTFTCQIKFPALTYLPLSYLPLTITIHFLSLIYQDKKYFKIFSHFKKIIWQN